MNKKTMKKGRTLTYSASLVDQATNVAKQAYEAVVGEK